MILHKTANGVDRAGAEKSFDGVVGVRLVMTSSERQKAARSGGEGLAPDTIVPIYDAPEALMFPTGASEAHRYYEAVWQRSNNVPITKSLDVGPGADAMVRYDLTLCSPHRGRHAAAGTARHTRHYLPYRTMKLLS